jgi:hypothetical protein
MKKTTGAGILLAVLAAALYAINASISATPCLPWLTRNAISF